MSLIRTNLYDRYERKTERFVNRTGSALAKGDVVAVDLTGSDGDVEAYSDFDSSTDRDTAHPFANVISVATAHLDGWQFAVATEAVADDEVGTFGIYGVFDVKFVGGSAVSAGQLLTGTNGETHLSVRADTDATVGFALEDGGSSAENHKAIFLGGTLAAFTSAGSAG